MSAPPVPTATQTADGLASTLKRTEVQHGVVVDPRARRSCRCSLRSRAGVESGWHTHSGEEVGYIVAGTVKMMIEGADRR